MIKLTYIILLIVLFTDGLYAQGLMDKSVARVGNTSISDKEFLERFEMTPGMNRQVKGAIESQKIEFLFSLIAEKLWSLEALSRSMDTTEVIKFAANEFEKMFIRDALFKKEIKDKIVISESELAEGLKRNSSKLYVRYLFSYDNEEMNNLYKLLKDGIPFDSILAESPEKDEQVTPVEIVYGQMDESVEEILFNLKISEFTKPILTPDGWYIFYLINKSEEMLAGSNARENAIKNVRKTIEARKLIEQQKIFYADFFKDKKAEVNPQLFETLSQNISSLFEYKKKNFFIKDGDLINLEPADIVKMEEVFGKEMLGEIFIQLDKNPITFKEYLRSLIFDGYNATDYKINFIRASLDSRVRKDIEKELLYRDGLKKGYGNLPEVKNDVEMWKQNYLFQFLKDQFRDSVTVTDDEVYSYYQKNNQPESYPMIVNIIEILTDSIETVNKIFNDLNNGGDFKTLAEKYNKNEWGKKKSGEYGFFSIKQHGENGRIAATMNVGDVYGPLKLTEGYSIFKLIEKQDEKVIPPKPFEKFKEQYKQDLTNHKLYNKITDFTYKLAVKFGVSLNLDLLEQIEVTSVPSFGMRFLGFGGKVTAVPLIAPNVDWAEEWIKNQQQQQVIP
ncbi:MAG TPA: peptidyl-prolyl cis-trans isomerase [Ignavibacteriaceae bacterium]|nr:peptidyl-prolyl cis-trans isomerase [Ignavibacteriaceae bacterium]